jgi:cell division transport system permease protein
MLWINLKRVLKSGFVSFWRNGVVSLSAVLVMVVTLFVIVTIIFSSALLNKSLEEVKDKVDVNVYFNTTAVETEIDTLKKSLEALPEVEFVEYVSKEQALADFEERHKNDQKTLEALDELDENPLGAVLNVKAIETSQYEDVAIFLDQNYPTGLESSVVEKVNYYQNKETIDKLSQIIDAGKKLGGIIAVIFIVIAIVITLNTIRLAMFISRDEIKVMGLVGASSSYISGPFVVAGAMYGVVSAIITLALIYPFSFWVGPITQRFFGSSVFDYYIGSFGEIFLIVFFSGILIGSISSFLAIKKYLRK